MKATVTKVFRFEAAHHLPNHDGKCREPHGHSYRVIVRCEGHIQLKDEDNPKHGMVVDFADIKAFWQKELEPLLDHKDLNETLASYIPETTAECIAVFICSQFMSNRYQFPIKEVEVWETDTSCAVITATEVWRNGG